MTQVVFFHGETVDTVKLHGEETRPVGDYSRQGTCVRDPLGVDSASPPTPPNTLTHVRTQV